MNKYQITFQLPDREVSVEAYCTHEQGASYYGMKQAQAYKLISPQEAQKGVKVKQVELLEENVDIDNL